MIWLIKLQFYKPSMSDHWEIRNLIHATTVPKAFERCKIEILKEKNCVNMEMILLNPAD